MGPRRIAVIVNAWDLSAAQYEDVDLSRHVEAVGLNDAVPLEAQCEVSHVDISWP